MTNQVLDAKLGELRGEIHAGFAELRTEITALSASVDRRLLRQTWVHTTTLIAGITLASVLSRVG